MFFSFSTRIFAIFLSVNCMKVKCFDECHEKDLEEKINGFLSTLKGDIIDIKYVVAATMFGEEQIYCFSAMVVYSLKE